MVAAVLAENGGSLTQAELIRKLSAAAVKSGDGKDIAAIVGLVTKEEFYSGTGLTHNGSTISIS